MAYWHGDPAHKEILLRPTPSNSEASQQRLQQRGVFSQNFGSGGAQHSSQLLEYWETLRRELGTVALLGVVGALAGFAVTMFQHPLYRARTVLDIRNLNENVLNMREGATGNAASNDGLPESYLQTEIKILQSETVLKRAMERMPKPLFAPAAAGFPIPFLDGLVHLPTPKQAPMTELMNDASRRIKVRALGNTRIVELLCDARDAQLAANMCNNLAQTYIEYNTESRHNSTTETQQWLSSQLNNVRTRLTQSESELKDTARDSDLLFTSELENPAQEKLRQIQAELSRASSERIEKESEYEVVSRSSNDSLPLTLDAGPIREYRMRLNELRRQLAEKRATMTPEHYEVRELTAQINQVESSLAKERSDLLLRLRTAYESSQRRESMLKGAYDDQAKTMSEYGDKAVRHEMLKRDVDSGRKLYEALLQRVEEVGLAAAMRTSTISIVDKAMPPPLPYSPNALASSGIGFFAASCLGVGLAMMRARADRTIRDPGDAPSHLRVRELGVIPSGVSFRPRLFPYRKKVLAGETGITARSASNSRRHSLELATWKRDQPLLAEAFCGTMASLLLARSTEFAPRTIVLTSPEVGDGKTAVASNLAIALARIKRKVVLVDGDMRKPRLNKVFDLPIDKGLATLLLGAKPIEEIPLSEIALPTTVDRLFVVPTASAKDEDIPAMLHSARLAGLLERLRAEFDVVIIDSPPMLFLSDARVLGSLSDGVLLVLRAGKTTREAASAAQQCLLEDGIYLLGTILNDWSAHKSRAYARYFHRYKQDLRQYA